MWPAMPLLPPGRGPPAGVCTCMSLYGPDPLYVPFVVRLYTCRSCVDTTPVGAVCRVYAVVRHALKHHRSCAYGLAAASPPASPKPNAVGGTQSILFFQGSGGVEFFSLRPLFWRLEVSEQPWERLRRGRRAGGCRTHQRVFVTFQSLQSQSRGGGWSGGAPHLPRLASLAGHLHAIATRGDTGESRRDLEPPRGANKQHARARRLVRAAARRVGGGCVGPCLDEQRDHLPRRRERVRVSPG